MTTQQKVSAIEQAVMSDVARKAADIRKRADESFAAEMAAAENEIRASEKIKAERGIANIDADTSRELSRRILEARRQLISRRDSLADGVFEEISGRLVEFTKTSGYRSYLKDIIERNRKILTGGRCLLLLREEDAGTVSELLSDFGISAETAIEPGILLGGLRISFSGRLIDETLDEKLNVERKAFAAGSGFVID